MPYRFLFEKNYASPSQPRVFVFLKFFPSAAFPGVRYSSSLLRMNPLPLFVTKDRTFVSGVFPQNALCSLVKAPETFYQYREWPFILVFFPCPLFIFRFRFSLLNSALLNSGHLCDRFWIFSIESEFFRCRVFFLFSLLRGSLFMGGFFVRAADSSCSSLIFGFCGTGKKPLRIAPSHLRRALLRLLPFL